MGRINATKRLSRTEDYWRIIQTCLHGDWCLDCHWICKTPYTNEQSRPVGYQDEKIIVIPEDIYLSLFPGGLDEESLLILNCSEPMCVNPAHQKRVSVVEMQIKAASAPNKPKKRSEYSRMTEELVKDIRQAFKQGTPVVDIARRFKTSRGNASMIVHRKTWRHVED